MTLYIDYQIEKKMIWMNYSKSISKHNENIGDSSIQLAIRSINSLERSLTSKFSVSDSSISYGISEQDVYIISSPSSGKNVVIFMYNEKVDPATCS